MVNVQRTLREFPLDPDEPPLTVFPPRLIMAIEESTFFLTVSELAAGLRDGSFSSVELTRAYLDRAEELDVPPFELPSEPREDHQGKLATMVTIARDHALEAAERADRELAAGDPRSILHGLPYGVKDLLDTRGIRTTWGSGIFRDRVPDRNAAVIDRLEEAGAVMMAKNSLGEFAGGNTSSALNPWKLDRTSFGSSSGTVSAAVAGLIGFGIGTETGGSIVFPASAVGASGLRPTFGRVSRFGCMALSWSLDKIGPVGRSAEDCGHVLEVIAGRDARDTSTADRPFVFRADPGSMRGRKRLGVHRPEFLLSQSDTTRQRVPGSAGRVRGHGRGDRGHRAAALSRPARSSPPSSPWRAAPTSGPSSTTDARRRCSPSTRTGAPAGWRAGCSPPPTT